MTEIDLSKAKVGDRYACNNGNPWRVLGEVDRFVKMLSERSPNGLYRLFRNNGECADFLGTYLIRKLPPETPVESQERSVGTQGQKSEENDCSPPKIEKYDPPKHGDGYSVMIPITVQPEKGSKVRLFLSSQDNEVSVGCVVGEKQWVESQRDYPDKWWWSFAPSAPKTQGPPKSYEKYLTDEGLLVGDLGDIESDEALITPSGIRLLPGRALALIDFIQDTLADGDAQ